ncbi:hypothetical protein GCM10023403_21470 [Pseudonocardia benzenivorans]
MGLTCGGKCIAMIIRHAKGTTSKQGRTGWPEGTYEDEHGRDGFAGEASMLYRVHPPTRWTRIEGNLKPRAIRRRFRSRRVNPMWSRAGS